MDRRTRTLFALAFAAVVVVAAAAALLLGGPNVRDGRTPADATSVIGVIVGVDAQGLDKVNGFTLRTTDQGSLVFRIGVLENGAEFPPGHLVEHQASAQPIRVWYRQDGDAKVAIRLEDAP